jgi:hypothetical protein
MPPMSKYKLAIRLPSSAIRSPKRISVLILSKILLSLCVINIVPINDNKIPATIFLGICFLRINFEIIPKNIGLVVTRTTLLAIFVNFIEVNQNMKCIDKKMPLKKHINIFFLFNKLIVLVLLKGKIKHKRNADIPIL